MKRKNYIKNSFLTLAFLFFLGSCKKFVQVDNPVNLLTTEFVFSDSSSAEATIIGFYSQMCRSSSLILNGNISLFPALSADELYRTSSSASYDEISNNSISLDNSLNSGDWNNAYSQIYQANIIIEDLVKAATLSEVQKRKLTGEARFLRALNYFYLVNYYGPVPLTITPDYQVNATLSRSDTSAVYAQIVSDLKDAMSLLGSDYPGGSNVRANKWAAEALLSRVYLYQKDWDNAVRAATDVIGQGGYAESPLANAFLAGSGETIFQFTLPLTVTYNTSEGSQFIPASKTAVPNFALRDQLLSAFETGDLRRKNWLDSNTVSGKTYYYPFKYKLRTNTAGAAKMENSIVLRLSEQYLIRAEALARQNKLSEAMTDLDLIRTRANLIPIASSNPSIGQDDLLQAIYRENQVEFFTEWGHRWFDLKRTGRASAVLASVKGAYWQDADVLYPIPNAEILTDVHLTQNPGYPQ